MEFLIILAIILFAISKKKKRHSPKRQVVHDSVVNKDADGAFAKGRNLEALHQKYEPFLKQHEKNTEKIGKAYAVASNLTSPNSPQMDKVVDMCLEDIKLAPKIIEYQEKWDELNGVKKGEHSRWFETFRRLAIIYEKQGRYNEAIAICKQAINLGMTNDGTDGGMIRRVARLHKKKMKNANKLTS